jgi:hypothetical protein
MTLWMGSHADPLPGGQTAAAGRRYLAQHRLLAALPRLGEHVDLIEALLR